MVRPRCMPGRGHTAERKRLREQATRNHLFVNRWRMTCCSPRWRGCRLLRSRSASTKPVARRSDYSHRQVHPCCSRRHGARFLMPRSGGARTAARDPPSAITRSVMSDAADEADDAVVVGTSDQGKVT